MKYDSEDLLREIRDLMQARLRRVPMEDPARAALIEVIRGLQDGLSSPQAVA